MDLSGKRALVTGGAVRIGRAITEALQSAEVEVVVHYHRSQEEATLLSSKTIQADLMDPAACESLIEKTVHQFGALDILINNAAVFYKTDLNNSTPEAVMSELQPNLLAPLALTRQFAKHCKKGHIINLLDRRITSHDTTCVPYQLSKKGLEELTRLSAIDLAPGIAVNAIAPGPALPPPQEVGNSSWEPAGHILLGRLPNPNDIAEAALYLMRSEVITGQVLFVDSGQNLLGNQT
jgi:NAD(P)-dependent dehydrogenase (short-subunit alcohol dehydrogenase family)